MTSITETNVFSTIDEFADSRRIHRATAYRLVERGTLTATRVGNRLMVSKSNAEDFDKRRETGRQLWPRTTAGAMAEQFRVLLGMTAKRDGKAMKAAAAELDRLGVSVAIPEGVAHVEQMSPSIAKQSRGELLWMFTEWAVAGSMGMTGEMIRLEKELSAKEVKLEVLV